MALFIRGLQTFRLVSGTPAATLTRGFSTLQQAVIVGTSRTPIGAFNGELASLSATELGSIAIKDALKKSGIQDLKLVEEVLMGNVVSAGVGQAPARQAALKAGLPYSTSCTTINKVCSSGMKAMMFAAQSVMSGYRNCMVAGGMESMSQIPYYLLKARSGYNLGHGELVDGVLRDGLLDSFDNQHMGMCAEKCAADYNFSREQQDQYALESFRRAQKAVETGLFNEEIVPVEIDTKKGKVVINKDESPGKLKADKVPTLRPAFKKDGTVTAANASSLNDGAAAHVITSLEFAQQHNLKPLAKILAFADAEQKPVDFTTTPALAIPLAIKRANLDIKNVDYFEINEAFSVVALANRQLLNIAPDRLNVNGGAVALGHPIGMSGARIVTTLLHVLKQKGATIGVAGICNGGGGASAIVIERL